MTVAEMTAVNALTHANPMANGANTGSSEMTANVSANDFLLLLVTEMKNQDPTAHSDPNEYVNQLVQVNSLQQLIEIKENLSAALTNNANAGNSPQGAGAHALRLLDSVMDTAGSGGQKGKGMSSAIPAAAHPVSVFAGNLSVTRSIPAAQRIAQALNGQQ